MTHTKNHSKSQGCDDFPHRDQSVGAGDWSSAPLIVDGVQAAEVARHVLERSVYDLNNIPLGAIAELEGVVVVAGHDPAWIKQAANQLIGAGGIAEFRLEVAKLSTPLLELVQLDEAILRTEVHNTKHLRFDRLHRLAETPTPPPQPAVCVGDAQLRELIKAPYGTFVVGTGGFGSGKSTVVRNMAFHAAAFPDAAGDQPHVSITAYEDHATTYINEALRFLHHSYQSELKLTAVPLTDDMREQVPITKDISDAFGRIIWHRTDVMTEPGLDEWISDLYFDHKHYGTRVFVLDPWNSHLPALERSENNLSYIQRLTTRLQRIAADLGVVIILMTHTPKSQTPSRNAYDPMTLLQAAGSGDFAAKAGVGLCIQRTNYLSRMLNAGHDHYVEFDARVPEGVLAEARSMAAGKPFIPPEHTVVTVDKVKVEGVEGRRGVLAYWVDRARARLVYDAAATRLAQTIWEG